MAARKLQTEIDKTLKKVAEGVEIFEDMYELLQRSTNSTQKEKMESDLKTQIKKLQRLRDQIKTWLQSNDIKDKKPLLDNRKLIETQMEKFKACEKEMKTKAFSKEGLIAAAKMNPKDREKAEISDWLSTQVDELSRQVEAAEAEIETISGSGKKKKGSAKDERASALENANDRRNWHISRLEILLRMLENGNLDTERVTDIKEDIAYFVESNVEEDFEEDEGIYDDLNLDDGEEAFGLKETDDMHSNVDSTAGMDDLSFRDIKDTPTKPRRDSLADTNSSSITTSTTTTTTTTTTNAKKEEPATSPAPSAPAQPAAPPAAAPPSATKKTTKKASQEPVAVPKDKAVPTANFAQAKAPPASQSAVLSPPKAPSAAPLPPIRYAAAAAAAVAGSAAASATDNSAASPSTTTASITNESTSDANSASVNSTSAFSAQPSTATAPLAPSTPAKSSVDAIKTDAAEKARSASPAPPGLTKVDTASAATNVAAPAQDASATGTSGFQPAQLAASSAAASVVQPAGGGAGTAAQQAAAQKEAGTEARLPTSLTDLVSSFESAKQKSLRRDANLGLVHKSLESSFMNVPEPLDSDKPKYYVPKNPFPTPSYYPQTPASVFDNPALYSKFDVDTLFYIFYYQQGTYHQYLAAKELKKQSWRFHKQYLTWFQRHSEPQAITDEYEQGVYVYFDWEGSWCQRKKSDFRFEYRWLEDN
ncbi:related to NOT3 - general negative regulator of transcription, subunit 3 [Ustilago trichophora]|uniref:General negative regulator of transcription subunit n=1 Tax=Ustilago trichophora TaxID=86804 RepID=A0A5C3EPE4_9BASI|nr:related to NOT3 - general negative regulator of transcription, subunit 3 [Ustilago trichophora]